MRGRSRLQRVAPALRIGAALATLAVAGVILLRFLPTPQPARADVPVIAVLPFRNLGQVTDQYFTDGLAEEITSRLAGVSGLAVISRTSADQYRDTRKPLRQVGKELGAAYLLEGSVRWDRTDTSAGGRGRGRVRVTPQLIRVSDDSHLWADVYDAELGEVFQLQTTIAEQVTGALEVTLKPPERLALDEGGTTDPEAYDLYLQGNDYYGRGSSAVTLAEARELYEKAIARDPKFARGWARLSLAHINTFWYGHDRTPARIALAKHAADSALALAPTLADAQIAMGYYYYRGHRDYRRALEHFEAARRRQPNNADLLAGIGLVLGRQGRWDEAVASLSEAIRRDPRSNIRAFNLGSTLSVMRRFPDAERELTRAITLAPDWGSPYVEKAQVYLAWRGDLVSARAVLAEGVRRVGLDRFAHSLISNDQTAGSVFTSDTASWPSMDRLTLQSFVGDTLRYYYLKAENARFRGMGKAERAYSDSLRVLLELRQRSRPEDPYPYSWLGIAYAGLGQKADAIAAGRRAVQLMPLSRDALVGPYLQTTLARTYMLVGEPELATATLEPLLGIPSPITREALRADPVWAPLRKHPRFVALIEQAAK